MTKSKTETINNCIRAARDFRNAVDRIVDDLSKMCSSKCSADSLEACVLELKREIEHLRHTEAQLHYIGITHNRIIELIKEKEKELSARQC